MLRAWIAGMAITLMFVLNTTTMMPAPTVESRKGAQSTWRVPHPKQEEESQLQTRETKTLPTVKTNVNRKDEESSVVDSSTGVVSLQPQSPALSMPEPDRLVKEVLAVLLSFQ